MSDEQARIFVRMTEVARRLDVSISRAYGLAREGRIPAIRQGRAVRIPRRAFEAWLARQEREALAAAVPDRPHDPRPGRPDHQP